MADQKISNLPFSNNINGGIKIPVLLGGGNYTTTAQDIANLSAPNYKQLQELNTFGYWIDDKPVYKYDLIVATDMLGAGGNTEIDLSDLDIETVVNLKGTVNIGGLVTPAAQIQASGSSLKANYIAFDTNSQKLIFKRSEIDLVTNTETNKVDIEFTISIEYTKTT